MFAYFLFIHIHVEGGLRQNHGKGGLRQNHGDGGLRQNHGNGGLRQNHGVRYNHGELEVV